MTYLVGPPMARIYDMPNTGDDLERELNALAKIKLRTDYEKLFVINQIYLFHSLPKELVRITYQMIYSRMIISAGMDNIIVNIYESHIFCKNLWGKHRTIKKINKIKKMIPSKIKQLFIHDRYFVWLSMNGEAYLWDPYDKSRIGTISKNIQYICKYYDDDRSDFFFQSFLPDNVIYQINLNEYYLFGGNDYCEITDETPYEMISCGTNHVMYLLKDGIMYAEGDNSCGQLCLDHTNSIGDDPVKVEIDSKISHVCCGDNFTLCKTTDDKILIYGVLSRFRSDVNEKIKIIGCSNSYAIALTDCDYLYVWGYNWYRMIYMTGIVEVVCYSLYIICMLYDETVHVISIDELDKIYDVNNDSAVDSDSNSNSDSDDFFYGPDIYY